MIQIEQVESGRLVRCSTPQMTAPFIGRILRIVVDRIVVEVLNYHFKDRRVVEQNRHTVVVDLSDAELMTIINCTV